MLGLSCGCRPLTQVSLTAIILSPVSSCAESNHPIRLRGQGSRKAANQSSQSITPLVFGEEVPFGTVTLLLGNYLLVKPGLMGATHAEEQNQHASAC